jgi:hypothetical protein
MDARLRRLERTWKATGRAEDEAAFRRALARTQGGEVPLEWVKPSSPGKLMRIESLGHVVALDLGGLRLRDAHLRQVAKLTGLRGLSLEGCICITDEGLQQLARLEHLEVVVLKGCKSVTGEGLGFLGELPGLRELNLASTELTDTDFLEGLDLQVLDFSECVLEQSEVELIGAMPSLQRLNLTGCEGIESLEPLTSSKVQALDLTRVEELGGRVFDALSRMQTVTSLRPPPILSAAEVVDLAPHLPHLEHLGMWGTGGSCDELDFSGFAELQRLEVLNSDPRWLDVHWKSHQRIRRQCARPEMVIDGFVPAPVRAERDPSGRAVCMECSETLEKGTLRVGSERFVYHRRDGGYRRVGYTHPRCAPKHLNVSIARLLELVEANSELSERELGALRKELKGRGRQKARRTKRAG